VKPRVLITGAAGLIGSVLRDGLAADYQLTGIDEQRISGFDSKVVDIAKGGRKLRAAFRDADVVVDLAASPQVSTPWDRVFRNNMRATLNAFEAAREAGVRRVVFASSNHVTGLYERDEPYAQIVRGDYDGLEPGSFSLLTTGHPVRPDSAYGVGKAFGEAAGRYFAEEEAMSVICLRIGTCKRGNRPQSVRELATFLTHGDLVHLVDRSIRAGDDVRFAVFYGVSNNTWRFWDIDDARQQIGYEPRENAEAWRADVPPSVVPQSG
jgi:nucleoside-diphosphate-sugar epimerase